MLYFTNVTEQMQAFADSWNAGVFDAMQRIEEASRNLPAQWSQVIESIFSRR